MHFAYFLFAQKHDIDKLMRLCYNQLMNKMLIDKYVEIDKVDDLVNLIKENKAKSITKLDLSFVHGLGSSKDYLHILSAEHFPNLKEVRFFNEYHDISPEFFANSTIEKAEISCRSLGEHAFLNCKNLKYIDLRFTKIIPMSAFSGTAVETLTIPSDTIRLNISKIEECKNLKSLNLLSPETLDLSLSDNTIHPFKEDKEKLKKLAVYLFNQFGASTFLNIMKAEPTIYIYLPKEKISKVFAKEALKIAKNFYLNKMNDLDMSISRANLYYKTYMLIKNKNKTLNKAFCHKNKIRRYEDSV